jgi:hypothetical protein
MLYTVILLRLKSSHLFEGTHLKNLSTPFGYRQDFESRSNADGTTSVVRIYKELKK